MENKSVFDAGPFIHLHEIGQLNLLHLFEKDLTTSEIVGECHRIKPIILKIKNVEEKNLTPQSKDFTRYLVEKYGLDLGESTGIALCKQERIELFFTDDLEAKEAAIHLGFGAHGTIAIIMRGFRNGLLTRKEAIELLNLLYEKSTLFLTKDLKDWVILEILKFKK